MSEEDGAITINADNVCLNGSVVTNGSIEMTATNFNVNGQRIEHAQQSMAYAYLYRIDKHLSLAFLQSCGAFVLPLAFRGKT